MFRPRSFWARLRVCACKHTSRDPSTPGVWSPCLSMGSATARGLRRPHDLESRLSHVIVEVAPDGLDVFELAYVTRHVIMTETHPEPNRYRSKRTVYR